MLPLDFDSSETPVNISGIIEAEPRKKEMHGKLIGLFRNKLWNNKFFTIFDIFITV